MQNMFLMYCWLYALLLAASIQPYGPSTTALQSYKDKGLAGTLMASTVPLVGRVVTDSLENLVWSRPCLAGTIDEVKEN